MVKSSSVEQQEASGEEYDNNNRNSLEGLMLSPRRKTASAGGHRSRSNSHDGDSPLVDEEASPKSSRSFSKRSGSRSVHRRRLGSSVGDLPLDGSHDDADTASSAKSLKKHKKRSKSKESAGKTAAKDRARNNKMHEGGYGSDGALDEHKKRIRDKRGDRKRNTGAQGGADPAKTQSLIDDAAAPAAPGSKNITTSKDKPPFRRQQSTPVRSLSPSARKRSTLKKFTNMFKFGNDSNNTLGTEELTPPSPGSNNKHGSTNTKEKERSRSKSKTSKRTLGKKRSNSTGPLTTDRRVGRGSKRGTSGSSVHSDGPLVGGGRDTGSHNDTEDDYVDNDEAELEMKKSSSVGNLSTYSSKHRSGHNQKSSDTTTTATGNGNGNGIVPTKSRFRLQEELEALQQQNDNLVQQLQREVDRSRRLRQKVQDMKHDHYSSALSGGSSSGDLKFHHDSAMETNNTNTDTNHGPAAEDWEQERKDLKLQLRRKDRRIAELERLAERSGHSGGDNNKGEFNNSSGHDSFESLTSMGSNNGGSDAIWNRLQVQLNEAREELAQKEEVLQTQTANLQLKTDRVAELEEELAQQGQTAITKLRDEVKQLQKEKKEFHDQLQTERRESEDRIQKKDEALIYFRNELQKLKETSFDEQRSLVSASQHSTTSQNSTTVQRAFGGISSLVSPALWNNKERVNMDNASISTPRLDD